MQPVCGVCSLPCGKKRALTHRPPCPARRSLHDAIMIVRRALKSPLVVPGGGAIDMELSTYLRWVGMLLSGCLRLI